MAIAHSFTVTVGAQNLPIDVFDKFEVTLDMFTPGSPFVFSISNSQENASAYRIARAQIKFGSLVKIAIDDSVQLTGRVEEFISKVNRKGGAIFAFSGRDMSGPAIDWDASPTVKLRGLSLGDALSSLFTPLGIAVRIGADVDDTRRVQIGTSRNARAIRHTRKVSRMDRTRPRPGERMWQVAVRMCARMGYLIWMSPDPDGAMSVIVDVPAYSNTPTFNFRRVIVNGAVSQGSNIEESTHQVSTRNIPTDVTVYTNSGGGAAASARASAHISNLFPFVPAVMGGFNCETSLVQPRHVKAREARTQRAALNEAQRIVADANAQARKYTVLVHGMGEQSGSQIVHYATNTMAHVQDDAENIDENMLIERLQFRGGRSIGAATEVRMHATGAMQLTPDSVGDG